MKTLLVAVPSEFLESSENIIQMKYHGFLEIGNVRANVILINCSSKNNFVNILDNSRDMLHEKTAGETIISYSNVNAMFDAVQKCKEIDNPSITFEDIQNQTGIYAEDFMVLPVKLDIRQREPIEAEVA